MFCFHVNKFLSYKLILYHAILFNISFSVFCVVLCDGIPGHTVLRHVISRHAELYHIALCNTEL